MLEMAFSSNIVHLIKSLYTDQSSTVRKTHRLTVDFRIEQGVQQVCILSSNIFNIYSEAIMVTAIEGFQGTVKIGGRSIKILRYADGIVLVGGSIKEQQKIVNTIHKASSLVGLCPQFNQKVIKISRVPMRNERHHILFDGQDIENLKSFA